MGTGASTGHVVQSPVPDEFTSSLVALESALLGCIDSGTSKESLLGEMVAWSTQFAAKKLGLGAEAINKALEAEMVPVHEEPDLSKLVPALRHFTVLGEDESVREKAEAAHAAQAALIESGGSAEALAAAGEQLREAHALLKTAYDDAMAHRVALEDLFQKAAEAVVAGGDAFSNIYSSVSVHIWQ